MNMETRTEEKLLTGKEAVEKMRALINHNAVCMFASNFEETPLQTRPMTTQKIDDEGNFWFLSARDSHKNQEVKTDSRVQLLFANTAESEYLTVYGRAVIVDDRKKIGELWSPLAKTWFREGKDDPNLTAIMVRPEHAYYWEPKYDKMVTLFKMAASAITGSAAEIGREGRIESIGDR